MLFNYAAGRSYFSLRWTKDPRFMQSSKKITYISPIITTYELLFYIQLFSDFLQVFYPDASHPEDITHPPSKSWVLSAITSAQSSFVEMEVALNIYNYLISKKSTGIQ
jgi:hypothetical protein